MKKVEATPNSPHDEKNLTAIEKLLAQAERLMITDHTRYDLHFKIWMSILFLKMGWPWQGVSDV